MFEAEAIKAPCKAAATAHVALEGLAALRGVELVEGDRILVTAQADPAQNGIWLCSRGPWKRARDADGDRLAAGALVMVTDGGAAPRFYRASATGQATGVRFERALLDDAENVAFLAPGEGAVASSVAAALGETVSVFHFMSAEQVADVVAGTLRLDVTAPIQKAIDFAIYQNARSQVSRGKVFMPAGVYKTTDTIHLGYGTSYSGVVLEGEGMRYGSAKWFCGTAIVAMFNDRPCIAFQGARNSVVRDLALRGKNFEHITANALGTMTGARNGLDDLVEATWVDPSFPPSSSGRYSPYAGIAIDPYSGKRPQTHYPDVRYPAFLGEVAQYGKKFSSNCLVENVEISGFVVGVANQPCDDDGNGDYTKLRRVSIVQCQYGVSIGNSQSRLVHVEDSTIVQVHTGFATTQHGRRNGKPHLHVVSSEIGLCVNWLNVPNLGYGGGPKFDYCYGEVMYSLGIIGGGGNGLCSTLFSSCEFSFTGRKARGEPAYTLQNTGSTIGITTFDSCTFSSGSEPSRFHFGGAASTYRFVGCNNVATQNASRPYEKFALNSTAGITFDRLGADAIDFSVQNSFTWNLATGRAAPSRVNAARGSGTRDTLVCVYSKSVASLASPGDAGVAVRLGSEFHVAKASLAAPPRQRGRTVTIETGVDDIAHMQMGGEAGDCAWDSETRTLFYVRARNGSTLTLEAQTNYSAAGELRGRITSAGIFHFLNCRNFSTTHFLQADTLADSDTVANAGRDDGAGFSNDDIAGGDFIAVFPHVDNALGVAGGANRIVARNGPARTFTTAGKWKSSAAKKRFALFWRAGPPNE